jgi:hypothetical protein
VCVRIYILVQEAIQTLRPSIVGIGPRHH